MVAHYDFFISGRWRNKPAVLDLTRNVRDKGYSAYCFLEAPHNAEHTETDPETHMAHLEALDWKQDDYIRRAFEEDMDAQKHSDTFVMLLPAGKSCHMEAGVAYGLGKKCVLIGDVKEAESLYLIFDETYETVDDFLHSLKRK